MNNIESEKSDHQILVEEFMCLAKQDVPAKPCVPSLEVRKLRAKLILEEALETIEALGLCLFICDLEEYASIDNLELEELELCDLKLKDIIDGCCDLKVVTTGTISACGIKDNRPQLMVDLNNLEKIEKGTIREDGKLIKPEGHKPPDWVSEIERQSKL